MVQLGMTQTEQFDIDSYEAEFGALALAPEAQDLLFRGAHTAYTFSDEAVSDEQLTAIYDLAKWGPTAFNSQPLRVVAVRTTEGRERLVKHLADGNKAKTETAPLSLILAADLDFHDELHRTLPVFPGARDLFADDDARTNTAVLNATLQAGYFLVAIRAAGLVAGPMTGLDAAGLSQEFFPEGDHVALMVVNVGHPADDSYRPRQPRLDAPDAIIAA